MLEVDSPIGAGEANVASSELTPEGDLHMSFYRGAFNSPETTLKAAKCAGLIIVDVHDDVLVSFQRQQDNVDDFIVPETQIFLEGTDDHLSFCELIIECLELTHPDVAAKCHACPSLKNVPFPERERYLQAPKYSGTRAEKQAILQHINLTGHATDHVDLERAFSDIRVCSLINGDHLVEGGDEQGFVYVPMDTGLLGFPLGGYDSFEVRAWTPLGTFGIIRGGIRAATLIAGTDLDVLIIPKKIYLSHWHSTYSIDGLKKALIFGDSDGDGTAGR
jgi:hypothetical protein